MNIGGEERPINFGINQTDLFCDIHNLTLGQYFDLLSKFESGDYKYSHMRDILWSALKDGARKGKVEFEFDKYDVGDWMDEDPAEYIKQALMLLVDSLPKQNEGATKKKAAQAR